MGRWIVAAVLVAVAVLLGWFSVANFTLWWESTHVPEGGQVTTAQVTRVLTSESCGKTTTTSGVRCTTAVDGIEFLAPDGSTQQADAHVTVSPGAQVGVFRDGDGEWQMLDGFTTGWVLRAAGLTGLAALALAAVALASLRTRRTVEA